MSIHIIHILHGFEGDIPEYLPQGDSKALECYLAHAMPGTCIVTQVLKKSKSVYRHIYFNNNILVIK